MPKNEAAQLIADLTASIMEIAALVGHSTDLSDDDLFPIGLGVQNNNPLDFAAYIKLKLQAMRMRTPEAFIVVPIRPELPAEAVTEVGHDD